MGDAFALAGLIQRSFDELLTMWREKVRQLASAKSLDQPTLTDHIPVFLKEIVTALEIGATQTIAENIANGSPPAHGLQRLENGFDLEEVVKEYHLLTISIHDLAEKNGVSLQGESFRILMTVMNGAIAAAAKSYMVQQALDTKRRREEYLAFVAHDLRTPLSAVSLTAQVMDQHLAKNGGAAQLRKPLNTLQRNARYLTDLVNKVLEENVNMETESGVTLERRVFDVWPLVESLIHDLRPIAGTGSTMLVNAVADDLTMFADASLIKRVFQNLIANAINHTPSGKVVISASRVGDMVGCEVQDNGCGIAAERLAYIFDKYETDSKSPSAIGLGLSICKTFVEVHGGTISATSQKGSGTTIRFEIPDHP